MQPFGLISNNLFYEFPEGLTRFGNPPENDQLRDCIEINWSFPRKIDESGQAFGESIEQVISKHP
jgi:hypothetical protein